MKYWKRVKIYFKICIVLYLIIAVLVLMITELLTDSYSHRNDTKYEHAREVSSSHLVTLTGGFPRLNITSLPWISSPVLTRALSQGQYDMYIRLLEVLTNLLLAEGISFILCDGSLLGSYVMHDMIPWDDDIDIMVRLNDIHKVKLLLSQPEIWSKYRIAGYDGTGDEYDWKVLNGMMDSQTKLVYNVSQTQDTQNKSAKGSQFHKFKFFYKDSLPAGNRTWNWPFIDVKYYAENKTHVWNLDNDKRIRYIDRDNFYPLHFRPFSRLWLPVPKHTRGFLKAQYHNFSCRRTKWSHAKEMRQASRKVRCWRLYPWYPFVWRENLPGGTLEVLRLDGDTVQTLGVPEEYEELQRPFAL